MFDRFKGFSTVQQVLLVGLVVCVTGGLLGSAWYFFLHTTYRPLFSGLRAADAATIVADLDKKRIPYELADGGATILVPSGQADATRLDVMTEDLPLKGTVGFELFNKSDMGLTDFAQKINYQRALQGELERTIMTLDGVESARVHLSLGEDRIFRDDRVPPKASISIRMKQGTVLSDSAAQGIAHLIAAAVPDLDAANVVILNESGHVVGVPKHVEPPLPGPVAQERDAIAAFYAARVREALVSTYSDAHVSVTVPPNAPLETVAAAGAAPVEWSPAARAFPIAVTVTNSEPIDPSSQQTVRALVENVIGTTPARPDEVAFAQTPPTPTPDAAGDETQSGPAATELPVTTPSQSAAPSGWSAILLAVLSLAALAGVYLVVLQLRRPRRMSVGQRADFAARIRAAIAKGEGHAAVRS